MQITRNPKTLNPLKIFHAQRSELLFGKKVNSSLVNDRKAKASYLQKNSSSGEDGELK